MPKTAVTQNKETFTCTYCSKTFKRERTLESHACEPRRRHRNKNEKSSQIAFQTYKDFYRSCQGSNGKRKEFQDFIKSRYYTAFISFGDYCIANGVFNSSRFAKYLITNEIPIDNWATESSYTKFLTYYIRIESVNDALTRTIEYGIKWAKDNNSNANKLLIDEPIHKIEAAVATGKISPWVLYNAVSGHSILYMLIDRSTTNDIVYNLIDPDVWNDKFDNNKEDVDFARNVLTLGGW